MSIEHKSRFPQTQRQEKLIATVAKEMDFKVFAKATDGDASQDQYGPRINWDKMTLEWREEWDSKGPLKDQKTLFFWRGEWGGGGIENFGVVIGETFAAFIYPNLEKLEGEVITKGHTRNFHGPAALYHPIFSKAWELSLIHSYPDNSSVSNNSK